MLDQLTDFDCVVVPVGGGGLISGIATVLKETRPGVMVVGVQSEWAVRAREGTMPKTRISPSSIADGIAVKTIGAHNKPILDRFVDRFVVIKETEVAKAIVQFLLYEKTVVEGAGAVGLWAVLSGQIPKECRRIVVVVSGSNIDMNVLSRLIERDMGERGRLLEIDVSVPDRPGSLHTITGIIAGLGANVLDVLHDRSLIPGNVDITFMLEVRDAEHRSEIFRKLEEEGIPTKERSS